MAKKLKIIKHPHDTLRQKAAEVPKKEIPQLKSFVDDMILTMNEANGIGLAAPQVNISKRIFVISTKNGALVIINPTLHKKSFKKEEGEEGCLSIPGVYGMVKRHYSVTVRGYNLDSEKISIKADGLFARVVQHEIDHVDGILFIDRAKKLMTGNDDNATQNI